MHRGHTHASHCARAETRATRGSPRNALKPGPYLGAWAGWSEWRNRFEQALALVPIKLVATAPSGAHAKRGKRLMARQVSIIGRRNLQLLVAGVLVALVAACSAGETTRAGGVAIYASLDPAHADAFPLDGRTLEVSPLHVFVREPSGGLEFVEFTVVGADGDNVLTYTDHDSPFTPTADGGPLELAEYGEGTLAISARSKLAAGPTVTAHATFRVASAQRPPADPDDPHEPHDPSGPGAPGRPATGNIWQPKPGTSWQWQLSGRLDTSVPADVYDIDLETNSAATIAQLHDQGRRVICYFSAGSFEPGRSDAGQFPAAVKGKKMAGWNELWLDIRKIDALAPVMLARLDMAVAKGCDAVEPDNVDGYQNDTGFPLKAADQLAYNRWLAGAAHERGLAIGLKNDLDQVTDLVDHFDFAVNEECFAYGECRLLLPFVRAGKAVFGAEYEIPTARFCAEANELDMDFIRKNWDLDAFRQSCR